MAAHALFLGPGLILGKLKGPAEGHGKQLALDRLRVGRLGPILINGGMACLALLGRGVGALGSLQGRNRDHSEQDQACEKALPAHETHGYPSWIVWLRNLRAGRNRGPSLHYYGRMAYRR